MNKKQLMAMVMAGIILASSFVGCSKNVDFVENSTTAAAEQVIQTETIEAVKPSEEIVSFTDKDKDNNIMTLSPIFDNDGETIIAGYILSAKDKAGKALDANSFKLLGSVVKSVKNGKTAAVVKDAKGELIVLETYSDLNGNIIAMVDSLDLDGDKNVTEILKIVKKMDANGVSKVMADYTTVQLKTEKGKTYIIDGDKKTEVKIVDSSNTEVAKKETEETKKNEIKKEEAKKKKPTTSTTAPSGESDSSTTAPSDTTKPANDLDEEQIVLKKNGKAVTGAKKNVAIEDGLITITGEADKEYEYEITSDTDLWHGRIVIKMPNTAKCEIKIKDVNISYNKGNVIQIIDTSVNSDRTFLEKEITSTDDALDNELQNVSDADNAPSVALSFTEGTSSSFVSEAKSYTGIMYNESKLTIRGNGKVRFESRVNSENCICSTKSITVKNVDMTLLTAQNNNASTLAPGTGSAKGIFSYNKVKVESGKVTVKTNGDGIRCVRFICEGGMVDVSSSACDAFDVDNEITISGGRVNAKAFEKSIFKVRRVNAGKIRTGKNDTFDINGGTVFGEGKKASAVQSSSKQNSITCSILSTTPEKTYGTRGKIALKKDGTSVTSASADCTTILYSSSSIDSSKSYVMSAGSKSANVSFSGKVGKASFKA